MLRTWCTCARLLLSRVWYVSFTCRYTVLMNHYMAVHNTAELSVVFRGACDRPVPVCPVL